jgi:hypothetical protein
MLKNNCPKSQVHCKVLPSLCRQTWYCWGFLIDFAPLYLSELGLQASPRDQSESYVSLKGSWLCFLAWWGWMCLLRVCSTCVWTVETWCFECTMSRALHSCAHNLQNLNSMRIVAQHPDQHSSNLYLQFILLFLSTFFILHFYDLLRL